MKKARRKTIEYLGRVCGARLVGNRQVEICGLTHDSRQVEQGYLFAALRGETTDGHNFLHAALEAGAVALLLEDPERLPPDFSEHCAALVVPDSRAALAEVAAAFYGYPGEQMTLAGVTGTNGKTTTALVLKTLLENAGYTPGVIGTLGAEGPQGKLYYGLTTPEVDDLQRLLSEFVDQGVDYAVMEVSAQAVSRRRIARLHYRVLIFTNLSQDHLDYYGTLERYAEAKRALFTDETLHAVEFDAVLNLDDDFGAELARELGPAVTTYALAVEEADFRLELVEQDETVQRVRLHTPQGVSRVIELPLLGEFNLYNVLAAASAASLLGVDLETIARGLEAVPQVPGRMERVSATPLVLVDYAHTEDGLRKVLPAARKLRPGRLLVVFGCGGDRDRTKRPKMGKVVSELADLCFVTSDNPRSEAPEAIIEEILPPMDKHKTVVEPDRRKAIMLALAEAKEDDVVVIAGKGHEQGQIFADRTVPFDDREVAREALRELRGRKAL